MKDQTKKQAIIHSLQEMDDKNADKVIRFINNLFFDSFKNATRQKLKEKAMRQIQKALQKHAAEASLRRA
ncbi:hypothetical protein [Fulvivirga lutea]|uniref:Uncharacterized protein n=1 Tax=Fulvivirga lutea TaxID=2810512 RepID=A0A974WMJ2_9BACT|nr:hypothetical protein [Fulvivirga lutea]QSE98178.1 hypothetical protein JR347_03610 [Fulvivirga lutea]